MTACTVRVADEQDRDSLAALRTRVFVGEQGVPADLETDAADAGATHVVAVAGDEVVGTGRLVVRGTVGQVGRMAVAPEARGTGVGALVLRGLEREARVLGLHRVELHAQAHAEGFYARAGYAVTGPRFVEAGLDHVPMAKDLPVRREVRDSDSADLVRLLDVSFAAYPGCVLDVDGEEPWLRRPASAYAEQGGRMWVCALGGPDGPVVACCGLKPVSPGRYELKNLYVDPGARRHGLGAELSELVADTARSLGGTTIQLWTDTRFTDAHRLYERLGYTRGPETRDLHDLSHTTEYFYSRPL